MQNKHSETSKVIHRRLLHLWNLIIKKLFRLIFCRSVVIVHLFYEFYLFFNLSVLIGG